MTIAHHHPHKIKVRTSILRVSALERLAASGILIALLWAAIFWAMA